MEEKDLITKLTLLKEIRPRENWVIFAKTRIFADSKPIAADKDVRSKASNILGEVFETLSFFRYMTKPAYVLPLLAVLVFGGITLQASRNSLPGDALFSVKSAIEKATMSNLELAQQRMGDLKTIAQENKVRNLSETIKEFKASVGEVSKNIAGLVDKDSGRALQAGRDLVQLQKDKAAIEQILGTALDGDTEKELKSATKYLVENELEDLLTRTLTEAQKALLEEGIMAYQAENYELALEMVWKISNAAD
ncbi:MAG: hypothetical protein A3C82_02620 [Candidatus Wildermuthbacteria bacterium RIFCSPHIGHO2_02_FULL_47_12]|uniref:DUF5667 domain-containing protein n=1 Tax=Candidatus Wildermuthbacteria bacterium RIFCSPHIGHO2_02_FULL_47_12 TaxID=1802451 RepID=A0A1G2R3G6_9BACT|nr:MAG: hypothetical protein A3C82_02620 [Candidatus Wildermuthbacteria bacterium RIFCSPHIGHO2_02_FULL_47_12]